MSKVKVTRTMNNSLVVGETTVKGKNTTIKNPFAMIPMEDGIRLIPLDIDLIGVRMDELVLTDDKVFYVSEVSKVIADEYEKLLNQPDNIEIETNEDSENPEKSLELE